MAVGIVDLLEVVEIEEHDRDRRVVAATDVELPVQLVLERAVVAEPRQRVDERAGSGRVVIGGLVAPGGVGAVVRGSRPEALAREQPDEGDRRG